MAKIREIYHCPICGNVVEVLHGGSMLTCCGKPMVLLEGNTCDGAYEKHVPVVKVADGKYHVAVGATEHPMNEEHYIQWIELLTPTCVFRRELRPCDKPEAVFMPCCAVDSRVAGTPSCEIPVEARAYCNLHGLWK